MPVARLDQALAVADVIIVVSAWVLFGALFLFHVYPPREASRKRLNSSWVGIVLQGCAVALVWLFQRPLGEPWFAWGVTGWVVLTVLVLFLAVLGVLMAYAALRSLGRQWSVVARVTDAHELVTTGPYAYVRHPIYTGLYALLIATGLAESIWWALLVAIPLFGIGTLWRARLEERLLRETFPDRYEAYAQAVPRILPRLRPDTRLRR